MLTTETDDGVRTITLRRPEKRNALTLELRLRVAEELRAAADAGDVAATVVTGEGSAFCAGFDTTQFGGDAANRRAIVDTSEAFFDALVEHRKPLVAAVNGPAVGGGFALALLSDVRVAAEEATFGFSQVLRGIPPSYAAARAVLPPALARELCLTGRMVGAEEALAVGLVSEVVPGREVVARATAIARGLAPANVVALVKQLARGDAEQSWLPLLQLEKAALRAAVLGE
jgi:enoyl-CoA hydratase